jgi:hypothetical protein
MRDKPVAAPGHGLDATRALRSGIEDAAQRRDLDREIAFLNHRSRPDDTHDLVLRYEIARAVDQGAQHGKGAGADADRQVLRLIVASGEDAASAVEAERAEQVDVGRTERVHCYDARAVTDCPEENVTPLPKRSNRPSSGSSKATYNILKPRD